ncbi:MAG: TonB-dependent receptor [Bacteroidetes bacterium]|nr:MAG: TonB-dependent receptor [Bacteroidota bacterium]
MYPTYYSLGLKALGICLLLGGVLLLASPVQAQNLQGQVTDSRNGDPLVGAQVLIVGTTIGTYTDTRGEFNIPTRKDPPFELRISYLGYDTLLYTVKNLNRRHRVSLSETALDMEEVEITAQRSASQLEEKLSLTVESLSLEAIKNTSEASFYDALANLREVDLLTVSFGFKVVNTRGFNSSAPVRSLQLIDGFDNASPGLNYPVGNFVGIADLDVEGVDLVIGASSAYFGPGAFNGVINMRSKNPFTHQGLDLALKAGERNYKEVAFRFAKALGKGENKKWAFKLNGAYALIRDWEANDYRPSRSALNDSIYEDNPGGFDAVNIYGDEPSGDYTSLFEQIPTRHPGLGRYYRTGYREEDLVDYDSYNFKASVAIHHRPAQDWEVIAASNFGMGRTVMQLDNRLRLDGVWLIQNKFEVKYKDRFFIRAYHTEENAGNTFDIVTAASILQNRWRSNGAWLEGYRNYWFRNIVPKVKALEGFPTISPPTYVFDFEQANKVLAANHDSLTVWHQQARASQDANRLIPGTPEFEEVFDDITHTPISEGGTRYVDHSKLFHVHAEYRFPLGFFDEVVIGGNYRAYRPYSEGTIFSDTSGVRISTWEYGAYLGLEKWLVDERLKLNGAVRVDKNKNYNYLVSPAISANYRFASNHSVRATLSSALRNPTLIEQYYYFRVGDAYLLGNLNGYKNLVTLESFEDYFESPTLDTTHWVRFDENPLVPEKNITVELGYSGTFLNDRLAVKSTYYFSRYRDFIGFRIGLQVPKQTIVLNPRVFRLSANARSITATTGLSIGINYQINRWLGFRGNYSWNRILSDEDDPLVPAYNTPENKFNVGLGANDMRIGRSRLWNWGVGFRWIEGYEYVSSPQFTGRIPAQYFVSGQVGKGFPRLKGTLKIAGSNLLNRRQNGLYGAPVVGRFVYAEWIFHIN